MPTTPNDQSSKDMQRYLKILQRIGQAQEEPSKEDLRFFINFAPTIDETKLQQLRALNDSGIKLSDEEFSKYNELLNQKAMLGAKDEYLRKSKELTKSKIGNRTADALNAGLAIGDFTQAQQQINAARRASRESRRPNRPEAVQRDPLLKQAIFEAQQGNFDTARKLAPAQLAILDQYLGDMNVAKTASTGQAGTYGALGQEASIRRGRNAQQLAPIADDIRARNNQRLDNLLQMRLGENQAIQQSKAQYYPTDMYQYQMEQQAIGNLGANGRNNLRQSLVNFGQNLPSYAAEAEAKRKYDKLKSLESAYNLEPNVLTDTETNLRNNWQEQYGQPSIMNYYDDVYGTRSMQA